MNKKRDLTKGSILKALLIVAVPTLFSSLIQMAYNLTDMFWVSKVGQLGFNVEEAVGAIGIAGFLPWFGFGLIMLAKIGTSVKVSQAAGMNDMKLVERIGNNGLVLMISFGILYTLFGQFGAKSFVTWMSPETPMTQMFAVDYLRIVTLAGLAFFTVNLFNGIYDGLGKTIMTLVVTSSGLILNMILDPIFILNEVNVLGLFTVNGLGMGVKGAAIATVIGQSSILLIYILIYISKHRPFTIKLVSEFDWKIQKEIIRIGVFVGLQSMLFTIISMIIARMINSYGVAEMAIQRVGSQIESVAWMIASGFQVALASFVGQNFGAKQYSRIKEGYKVSMRLLVPYGIVVNIALFVFAKPLFGIFFDNPETLQIGKTYLEILSISQLFMIVELATAGVFNGLGKTWIPSVVGVVGNIIRIPTAIILSAGVGYAGIWWGVSGSSILKGVVLVIWVLFALRKLGKPNGILFENKL